MHDSDLIPDNVDRGEALKKGYDQTAPFYDLQYKDFQIPKYQEALRLLPLPIKDMDKVLDHGCGTGLFFEYLRKQQALPHELIGLDYSPGMLENARARGMTVIEGTIESLPFEDNSFDGVFSFTVLRIIQQDEPRIIGEIARVLKKGGYCALSLLIDFRDRELAGVLASHGLNVLSFEYVGQDMMFICRKG